MCILLSLCTQVSDIGPRRSFCFLIASFIIFIMFDMIFQFLNNKYINISCNCYFLSHFSFFSTLPTAPCRQHVHCFDYFFPMLLKLVCDLTTFSFNTIYFNTKNQGYARIFIEILPFISITVLSRSIVCHVVP